MPRKNKIEVDSKVKEKLEYIGLDLDKLPKILKEYSDINFRTLKGYDEKKYKQYRFVNVSDIEILLSPTNRMDTIKEKYENAMPICYYLDSKNEENILAFTEFLSMLNKVNIPRIEEIEAEQKMLSKGIPFKIKFNGNYLWQIYYSEISDKYFMIVPIEDTDYSTFFYILKRKIENKKNDRVFVPISLVDYEGILLKKEEIKDLENYLWLFTKDYPSIYEVWDKKDEPSINIIGETELFDNIKTLYKVQLTNAKEANQFYKLVKALFILQTELPHYYKFTTNIDEQGMLEFYFENSNIKYKTLPEFIMQQYLRSVSLKNKTAEDLQDLREKLSILQKESKQLEEEYMSKEKQITTFLECKKTFFGKVKYFFKLGKKATKPKPKKENMENIEPEKIKTKHKPEKFKMEEKNYTLYELEKSYKELESKENQANKIVMDINALKLKNKNLKKKIENASSYIDEINEHKKSIFEFWKYSNKDAVASLEESEEEEFNVKKLEKIFNCEDDFEDFGANADKNQRNKLTDSELESVFIASTDTLPLLNRMNLKVAENKEISAELKKLKLTKVKSKDLVEEDDDNFNIFGRIRQTNNKERTIGSKTHREQPRDRLEILEIRKETRGLELKKNLEKVLENIKKAIKKNVLQEDMYVYKVASEELEFNTIEDVSLNSENELNNFLKKEPNCKKLYLLYKIKLSKGTNFAAFTNIIFFDNKNMTLPLGMNLSDKILVDLSEYNINEKTTTYLNKLQFEEDDDFANIIVKNINLIEVK